MSDAATNIAVLAQDKVKTVREFQGQDSHPLFQWMMKGKKETIDEISPLRVTLYLSEPGGFTAFDYSAAPDFRAPVSPEDDAMRVYPAQTAQAIRINGNMLRGLKAAKKEWFIRYDDWISRTVNVHKKELSRHFHGDGSGTVSVAANTIGGTGVATLNGTVSTGGTSGVGRTKGTAWLRKGETYDAINPSTEAVRGTFVVLSEGRQSCSINVTSGTVSTSDPIVVTGTWKKVPVGLRHLADFNNRVLQNFDTTNAPNLNTPVYDAGGNAISPSAFSYAKGLIQTFMNDVQEEKGKLIVMTPGHQKTLVNQAFQYREYTDPKGNETAYGVFSKYVDMDGDVHFIDADAPDEQIRILDGNAYGIAEAMPFGFYDDLDTMKWRMLHGANSSGSDRYFTALGWQGNPYKAGVAFCDAIIDDVAHDGADYVKQAYA